MSGSNGVTSNATIFDAFNRPVEIKQGSNYTQIVYAPDGYKFAFMSGTTVQKYMAPLAAGLQAVYTQARPNPPTYWRHSDWLGSSRIASTATQTAYYDGAYAPYGENYAETGTPDRSFTGQTQDTLASSSLGIIDFLFRQESASQGRWLVPDPAGIAAVDPANPQTWNRYAYVGSNPVSNIDALGLDCTTSSGESCGSSGTPFIRKNVSAPYYPGGWWDLAFEGWPGMAGAESFFCMLMGGCSFGNASSSDGGGTVVSAKPQPQPANNGPACAPSGTAPAPSVYQQRGQLANNMTNSYDPYGMSSAAGAMYNLSELYQFKRGNALDAQVRYGGSPAYANYVFGVYLGAVGWTLPQTLAAANDYARTSSSYPSHPPMDPNYPSTPAANVANITAGYNAQQNGTLCHK